MKKAIIYLAMFVMLSSIVFGGSIENLDYKDRWLFGDNNRQVDDYSVNIDADTLEGQTADQIATTAAGRVSPPKIEGGMDKSGISKWLIGDGSLFKKYDTFKDWLVVFLNENFFESRDLRMDRIEAIASNPGMKGEQLDLQIGLVTAKRTGEKVKVDGHICSWFGTFGECTKVSN